MVSATSSDTVLCVRATNRVRVFAIGTVAKIRGVKGAVAPGLRRRGAQNSLKIIQLTMNE